MRTRRPLLVPLLAALIQSTPAHAAVLRPYAELQSRTVHLADLFDALGNTPDRALGRAPAPGDRIIVDAPQLAAIARDFGVDWRPQTGRERAILQRRGQRLPATLVQACLMAALRAAGAPTDGDVVMPSFEPPVVGAGPMPSLQASQVSYDPATGRFTASLAVQDSEDGLLALRLSGQVVSMRDAASLTRHLPIGTALAASDVEPIRVKAATLRGRVPLSPAQATGLALRHDVAPGQPLTSDDLAPPTLVARGATVRMTLDTDGIALTAQGLALDGGGMGERIRIQNPASRAIVTAEITGPGLVRVAPNPIAVTLAAVP